MEDATELVTELVTEEFASEELATDELATDELELPLPKSTSTH